MATHSSAVRRQLSPEAITASRAGVARARPARLANIAERKASRLFCACGSSIPRPENAGTHAHYTCPRCCDALLHSRSALDSERLSDAFARIDAAAFPEFTWTPLS